MMMMMVMVVVVVVVVVVMMMMMMSLRNAKKSNLIQKTNDHQRLIVCFCTGRNSFSLRSYVTELWYVMSKRPKNFCDIFWSLQLVSSVVIKHCCE